VIGLVAGGGGIGAIDWLKNRPGRHRPRALVLMPQGGVIGLHSGAYPFRWREVERFTAHELDGRRALKLDGPPWARETLDETWFDAPIELVVAAAEAYRVRWSALG
jgi:hypothetical protein